MSLFAWFGKKPMKRESTADVADIGSADVTLPINHQAGTSPTSDHSTDTHAGKLERREHLYGVVRECMTAIGVLSSSYKFKVLTLDSNGRKYLVLMDMPREFLAGVAGFADVEGAIARNAKERFDIQVIAVYWRVIELVSAVGHRAHHPAASAAIGRESPATRPTVAAAQGVDPNIALQQEEILAFKRAVAAAAQGAAGARSETRKSVRSASEAQPDFRNTEPFENMAPLGPTQFGGLN